MRYRYRVVDVFTTRPLEGNPLAVFPGASGLDDATMQKIARELSLSETTFILPAARPDCAARMRIFTPNREMDFAGHPIIGTGFVLLDEMVVRASDGHFMLDIKVGPVPIRVEAGECPRMWLTTPPISWGKTYDRGLCAEVAGLRPNDLLEVAPQLLSAGNPTVFIAMKDKAAVDRAWIDLAGSRKLKGNHGKAVCNLWRAPRKPPRF